ncbi:transglutaminase [Polynucleobacter sp. TUM22923]|uniref:transglutaminase family protein n=1 Tax=Polynucleobacter sp. TUM22923 TaxID=3022126 RepID=UPI002572A66A|nr:transglutaminase family protein [Polynucleobacter sp. TUM22923]BDX21783.1 transglutaminase [Polynucleobacter sp. TUM22923]
MHLKIRHRTEYRYDTPVHYSIQELRLTPPQVTGQTIDRWKISTPMKASNSSDAFGNQCSIFTQESPYTSMMIEAEGEVHTQDNYEFIDEPKAVSPYYLLQQTHLTEPTPEMLKFFAETLPTTNSVTAVLTLAAAVQAAILYFPGQTNFATTAAQSFAIRSGVCQDHAHIMLGLCRASGIPARYVSGYFFAEESPNLASHAWIDFCTDINQGVWTSIDITNSCLVDSRHIRLAIGRDYYSAAPVKGVRSGGEGEELSASISINQVS